MQGDGSARSAGHGGLSLRNFVDRLSELNVVCPVLAFSIGSIDPAISIYLTHTLLNGKFTLRLCIGQTQTAARHVERAWNLIQAASQSQS